MFIIDYSFLMLMMESNFKCKCMVHYTAEGDFNQVCINFD